MHSNRTSPAIARAMEWEVVVFLFCGIHDILLQTDDFLSSRREVEEKQAFLTCNGFPMSVATGI